MRPCSAARLCDAWRIRRDPYGQSFTLPAFLPTTAGQLLGLTIAAEEPQLEAQRAGLMQQQEALALEVAGLEKQLLESLASST